MFLLPSQEKIDEKMRQLKPKNISMEDFKQLNFVATPDDCKKEIRQYASLGVTYFMLFFGDLPDLSSVRLFSEVIKTLKQ